MFARRLGHLDTNYEDDQRAPIFLQFLDAVWQVIQQFPRSFEFNEKLLEFVLDASNSGQFGTFLLNCERERREAGIFKGCRSIWAHVLEQPEGFTNPHYRRNPKVLRLNLSMRKISLWHVHMRWSWRHRQEESIS